MRPTKEEDYFPKCGVVECFAVKNGRCTLLIQVKHPCAFYKTRKQAIEDLKKHPYHDPRHITNSSDKSDDTWYRELMGDEIDD